MSERACLRIPTEAPLLVMHGHESQPRHAAARTCLLSASCCCPLSAPPVMHRERRPLYLRRSRQVAATWGVGKRQAWL